MTSFGWKRKSVSHSKSVASVFTETENDSKTIDLDWLTSVKKAKRTELEDTKARSQRLKDDGSVLAENGRFWEAIKRWDEAILLSPKDATLHEMKAQALMQVGECIPAVKAAEMAVNCNSTWWVAHQTLGRAHLGVGMLKMAVRSFSQAVHINPVNEELRKEDLGWAVSLLKEEKAREERAKISSSKEPSMGVHESSVNSDEESTELDYQNI